MTQPQVVPIDPALFASAEQAVRFALSRDGNPPRPASSRMLDAMTSRREFSALDQAAQAGMIINLVEGAGRFAMAVMTAAVAPRSTPCNCRRPCCSGKSKNLEWHRAINIIADEAIRQGISRCRYMVRVACVMKVFGEKISQKQIAEDLSLDEDTVSKHFRAIQRWLLGAKAKHGNPPEPGQQMLIWREAEGALRAAGIVG